MKSLFYNIWSKFLTILGDIKIFKWPFWLIYDPSEYEVTGRQVLEIMDILKEGDIILRGYNHYLDGKFIPNKTGYSTSDRTKEIGLDFSHGAIYIGNNEIIHSIAEGVSKINVLDFCQCDRIAIFHPKAGQRNAISKAKKFLKDKTQYDFDFKNDEKSVYCFELVAACYPKLSIPTFTISKLFGLIKKKDVYIAQSFIDSADLELEYCWNPKYDVDFKE